MQVKKALMGYAAFLILLFHFYIPVTQHPFEAYIYRSAYLGVDLFFFLSGYSLGKIKELHWERFIKNRFSQIYIPFAVFSILAALLKKWSFEKLLLTLTGISLFQKGGGSFLWFLPGILFLYFLTPILFWSREKFGQAAFLYFIVTWLFVDFLLQFVFDYTTIFILLNRLPIFLIGFFSEEILRFYQTEYRYGLLMIGLTLGNIVVYSLGTFNKLNWPFQDMFYLLTIPLVLSLVGFFHESSIRFKNYFYPLEFLGNYTLELYGLQMLFGYQIESYFFHLCKNGTGAFIGTFISLIILSMFMKHCFDLRRFLI